MEPTNPEEPREESLPATEERRDLSAAEIPTADLSSYVSKKARRRRKRRVVSMIGALIKAIALLVMGAVIALLVVPNAWVPRLAGMSQTEKINLLGEMVRNYYIDGDEVDEDALTDALAAAYIYGLGDPYSAYFNEEQLAEVMDSNRGNFSGIGVSVTYAPDPPCAYVIRVYKDSPAYAAGIRPGDRVTAVAGVEITVENYSERVSAMRGVAGSTVTLSLLRDGEPFETTATRATFTIESVFARTVGDVGVIEVTEFNQATSGQFRDAVAGLQAQGVTALVIDMRGNPGGLIDVTSEMLDLLLPAGELGYAIYNGDRRESLATSDSGQVDLPMAILTDGNTASAAEYFVSAMRDFEKAILVGETTYGKGIMQSTMPLGDGTAVRLTVAKFYTKSGTEFHGIGLKPDIEVSLPADVNRFLIPDEEDAVLQAALDALKK